MGPAPPSRLIPARAGKTRGGSPTATVSTAHPRACGENDTGGGASLIAPGSSPRVRGKRARGPPQGPLAGLIPARAGKTWSAGGPATRWRAHPRACGENHPGVLLVGGRPGSSPRVRGKRVGGRVDGQGVRLIPARAGKTDGACPWWGRHWAHPRACGENLHMSSDAIRTQGSSPRVRGKHLRGDVAGGRPGLIPARAGKTQYVISSPYARSAHPRACGENLERTSAPGTVRGSSPRVRGKQRLQVGWPAFPVAHPRACGENGHLDRDLYRSHGSSPRVRGKPPGTGLDGPRLGLIPARAGKTRARTRPTGASSAHPRACGENRFDTDPLLHADGSSPRVRGKPVL